MNETAMRRPTIRQLVRGGLGLVRDALAVSFHRKRAIRHPCADGVLRGTFYDADARPAPGVLLLPTSLGTTPHDHAIAARLAGVGFTTLVVDYTGRTTGAVLKDESQRQKLERRVLDAFDLLRSDSRVDASRTAVVGLSLGGYFATYIGAWTTFTAAPKAVVVVYGMYEAAEPMMDRLQAPLLILQGERDSPAFVASARRAHDRALGCGTTCELSLYRDAGHQFDLFDPSGEAATDAWRRTTAFLKQHLDAHPPE